MASKVGGPEALMLIIQEYPSANIKKVPVFGLVAFNPVPGLHLIHEFSLSETINATVQQKNTLGPDYTA